MKSPNKLAVATLRPAMFALLFSVFGVLPCVLFAQPELAPMDVTLTVSPDDPEADFRSIQSAATKALTYAANGQSVRVLIKNGLYRERIDLAADTSVDYAPIAFVAEELGRAVISGSEIWNGWSVGDESYFEKDYAGAADVGMVFVQGIRLVRMAEGRPLLAGQYRVESGRVQFVPPGGATVIDGVVEVALDIPRPLLRIQNLDTLTLSGLYIRQSGGVGLMLERNWTVALEHCTVEHHYAAGMMVAGAGELTLYNVDALRNGKDGVVVLNTVGFGVVGGSVSLNGFRVSEGKLAAKDSFGLIAKTVQRIALRNYQAGDNRGQGVAILGASEVAITRCKILNNRHGGGLLFRVESATLLEAIVAANGNLGLTIVASDCTAAWSVFSGNHGEQGAQVLLAEGGIISLDHCILASEKESLPLIVLDELANVGTLSGNLYWGSQQPFLFNRGTVALDFPQWQAVSGEDLDSAWGDPMFNDPARFEFIPRGDSIWYQQKTWPTRELAESEIASAREEFLGIVPGQAAVPEGMIMTPTGPLLLDEPEPESLLDQ